MLWLCPILYCLAFAAAALATPAVITLARRFGAVDAPDGFRKIGHADTPRMGGLAVAFGVIVALTAYGFFGAENTPLWMDLPITRPAALAALALVLTIGIVDDRRGLGPSAKLVGQAVAATLLYMAEFRIEKVFLFGFNVDLGPFALPVTCFWFVGCMNVWNLIDGMDGLASGVGAIVCATLAAAAAAMGHGEVALAAAALAGALSGFLVHNFHPARIFLGDTGSLLLGALLGMFAIRGSLKSGMTVAIVIPALAMGLPIGDTLLAIARRWVRRLPMSAPDRGHVHHWLQRLGCDARQAAYVLYAATAALCFGALASVALQSDALAVLLAALAALGIAAVFAARRDHRDALAEDLKHRLALRRQERAAAQCGWEAIQRLAHADGLGRVAGIVRDYAAALGCDGVRLRSMREAHVAFDRNDMPESLWDSAGGHDRTTLRFALADWPGEELLLELQQPGDGGAAPPLAVAAPFARRFAREALLRVRQLYAEAVADAAPDAAFAAPRTLTAAPAAA